MHGAYFRPREECETFAQCASITQLSHQLSAISNSDPLFTSRRCRDNWQKLKVRSFAVAIVGRRTPLDGFGGEMSQSAVMCCFADEK